MTHRSGSAAQRVHDRALRIESVYVVRLGSTVRRVRVPRDGANRNVVPSENVAVGGPGRDADEGVPARKSVGVADMVRNLGGAALGAAGRLPRRPGGSGGRAPAADEDDQRSHACSRDDGEEHVEGSKAASVGEAPRTVGARLRTGDDSSSHRVRRHGLCVCRSLVHHIVGHELSSDRSTSGTVSFAPSSRSSSSSPKSSRRAFSTSAICSTASRLARMRL